MSWSLPLLIKTVIVLNPLVSNVVPARLFNSHRQLEKLPPIEDRCQTDRVTTNATFPFLNPNPTLDLDL